MDILLSQIKSEKCYFNCNNPSCVKYHSSYDYRRSSITYSSIMCLEFIQTGLCTHSNCRFCSNYTEYLYHPNNYKTRQCIAKKIGAQCKQQDICPFSHFPNEREQILDELSQDPKVKLPAVQNPPTQKSENPEVVQPSPSVCLKSSSSIKPEEPSPISQQTNFLKEEFKIDPGKDALKFENSKPVSSTSVQNPAILDPSVQDFSIKDPVSLPAKLLLESSYIYMQETPLFEDRFTEFKECRGRNFDITYACNLLSTYVSAFLNSEGGTIFYGISDQGIVTGVKLIRRSRDLFTQNVDNILNKFRPPIGIDLYTVSFKPVLTKDGISIPELYVIELVVKKGDPVKIYYTHKEEAFIKRDSSVSQLKGPALVEFSRNRG